MSIGDPRGTEQEARFGIEDDSAIPGEPGTIPLTAAERAQRAALVSDTERESFDIWTRLRWRQVNSSAAYIKPSLRY